MRRRRRRIDVLQTLKRRRVSTGLITLFKYLELIMIRISKIFRKQIEVLGTNYIENSFRSEFSHSSWTVVFSNYNVFNYTIDHISTPTAWTENSPQGETTLLSMYPKFFSFRHEHFSSWFLFFLLVSCWDENYFRPGLKFPYNHVFFHSD